MKSEKGHSYVGAFRHQILQSIGEGVVGIDGHCRFTFLNPAACRLLGFAEEKEALGRDAHAIVDLGRPDGSLSSEVPDPFRKVLCSGLSLAGWEGWFRHQDGTRFPVQAFASPLSQLDGPPAGVVMTFSDMSERKALEAEVARETAFSQAVIRNLPGVFYMIDRSGQFVRWNRRLEEVTGHEGDDMRNVPPPSLFPDGEQMLIKEKIEEVFHAGDTTVEAHLLGPSGEGTPYYFTGFGVELDDDTYLLGVGLDISDRKAMERELERLATHDQLTGLYNRTKLAEFLEQARIEHERYGTPFSVIMFDIDEFKAVNDRFGHQVGDEALVEVTRRINDVLREADSLARWGGEEFLVLAPHTQAEGAAELAERQRQAVAEKPFDKIGSVTISLGVASYEAGEPLARLEHRVDKAMYRAKEAGRNRVAVAESDNRID